LHAAVAQLHEQQLQWQVSEAKLQQDLRAALIELAATKEALAAAESRVLELIADFTERDVKSARDTDAQIQAVKRACDIRIQQVQAECAESARNAADAAAVAMSAVREECGIQLQSAKDSCFALEQRCATFSAHLITEQNGAELARVEHERTEASLRMECDQISAALSASRCEVLTLVSDVARLQKDIQEREQLLQDAHTDIVKMRDAMSRATEEKFAAEKHAQFLQEQLHEATALAQKRGDAERKEREAACTVKDLSQKMAVLEVRVQQLAHELDASVGELAEARAASVASRHGLDDVCHELLTVKEECSDQKSRFEGEIKHLQDHLKETAAGRVAAEDENSRLKNEIIELRIKIVELTEEITEQQKNAIAGAEETREIHLKALNFVKEQHNHQTKLLADHHAQQKQLWLHTEQELRETALERKQAANAALASRDIQTKAAEALVEDVRRENSHLADQVGSLHSCPCFHFHSL
jgi:chromosome segregation ATPase